MSKKVPDCPGLSEGLGIGWLAVNVGVVEEEKEEEYDDEEDIEEVNEDSSS